LLQPLEEDSDPEEDQLDSLKKLNPFSNIEALEGLSVEARAKLDVLNTSESSLDEESSSSDEGGSLPKASNHSKLPCDKPDTSSEKSVHFTVDQNCDPAEKSNQNSENVVEVESKSVEGEESRLRQRKTGDILSVLELSSSDGGDKDGGSSVRTSDLSSSGSDGSINDICSPAVRQEQKKLRKKLRKSKGLSLASRERAREKARLRQSKAMQEQQAKKHRRGTRETPTEIFVLIRRRWRG